MSREALMSQSTDSFVVAGTVRVADDRTSVVRLRARTSSSPYNATRGR